MLYHAYELQRSWLNSASAWASINAELLTSRANPFGYTGFGPMAASALDVFAHATAPRDKPAFGIKEIALDGEVHPVEEATVVNRPFGDLKRFRHTGLPESSPRILIVAPMSGHFATLLRDKFRAQLAGEMDCYTHKINDASINIYWRPLTGVQAESIQKAAEQSVAKGMCKHVKERALNAEGQPIFKNHGLTSMMNDFDFENDIAPIYMAMTSADFSVDDLEKN